MQIPLNLTHFCRGGDQNNIFFKEMHVVEIFRKYKILYKTARERGGGEG